MVGRFVEQEQVARRREDFSKQDPAAFPARKNADSLLRSVAAEHHQSGETSRLAAFRTLDSRLDFLFDGVFEVQTVDVCLPEVIHEDVRVERNAPGDRRKFVCDEVQERRFAASVRPDDRDAVALEKFDGQVLDKGRSAVEVKVQILDLEHPFPGERRFVERKFQVALVFEPCRFAETFDRLDFGLDHRGLARLEAESVDDAFELFALVRIVFLGAQGDFFFGANRLLELCYRTLDFSELFPVNPHDMRADFVHEFPVVRDEQDFAFPPAQKAGKPAHRYDVEIVGRFVEQEHVRFARKNLGEVQPDLETAREEHRILLHGTFVESEAEKDRFDMVRVEPAVFVFLEDGTGFFVDGRMRKGDVLF